MAYSPISFCVARRRAKAEAEAKGVDGGLGAGGDVRNLVHSSYCCPGSSRPSGLVCAYGRQAIVAAILSIRGSSLCRANTSDIDPNIVGCCRLVVVGWRVPNSLSPSPWKQTRTGGVYSYCDLLDALLPMMEAA